jgi:hypothetical protein
VLRRLIITNELAKPPLQDPETRSAFDLFSQQMDTNRPFQFQKRSQLFIRVHNETFSVIAVRINDPDCSQVVIHG